MVDVIIRSLENSLFSDILLIHRDTLGTIGEAAKRFSKGVQTAYNRMHARGSREKKGERTFPFALHWNRLLVFKY